ncbi:MAG TPA: YhdP family protein [Chiayiivirga sp.]|nr:YhdP family protein [Chiayiivirga sp.]
MTASRSGRWRHRLRHLRRMVGWCVLGGIIALAMGVAVVSQLLPLVARHPQHVAEWLSVQIKAPVSLGSVQARWNRAGPELTLRGLRIGGPSQALEIDGARLQINVYSGLWPGMPLTELRISKPELELSRKAGGEWQLRGIGRPAASASNQSPTALLDRFGAIDIEAASLRLEDEVSGRRFELARVDARLQRRGTRLLLGAVVQAKPGSRLRLAADLGDDARSGTLYLEGLQQDWAEWSQSLSWQELDLAQARGDIRLWIDLSDGQPVGGKLQMALAPFNVRQHAQTGHADDADAGYTAEFARWQLAASFERSAEGTWALRIPQWKVADSDETKDQPEWRDAVRALQLVGEGSKVQAVQAEHLDLAALSRLGQVLPRVPEALRRALATLQPFGALRNAGVRLDGHGRFRLRGSLDGLGWASHGRVPGIAGISGELDGDQDALRLSLTPGPWKLGAPGIFRDLFQPQVDGELLAFRVGKDWRIDTPGLRLRESDYDITLAGGAQFPARGGAVLDLRADVAEAPLVVAKRFWPMNVMPPAVVHWLDTALVDGKVAHGAALVRGNVLDWPFRHGEGRFEAVAELADATLKFHHDWPQGHGISGTARFINVAMEVDLKGQIGGAQISRVTGGIPNFGDAILELAVQGDGTGPALLGVLRESSLRREFGSFMQNLTLTGRGNTQLDLHIPLEKHLGEPSVDGYVDIERMDLHDPTWGLGFQNASGRVRYSNRGFSADELNVGFADTLATLNIAVGDYTSHPSNVAEASVRGRFSTQVLAASNPHSAWLSPWFSGDSDWTLQLTVPKAADAVQNTPSLRIRSDLVGTAITLPAPLRKAASDRLGLDIELGLPLAEHALTVRLGSLLRLQGRVDDAENFNGFAVFGDAPDPSVPERGLRIVGQVPVLDAEAWSTAFAQTSGASDLFLDSLDLFVGELNLLGTRFRETGLSMTRTAQQVALGFRGGSLDGTLAIPLVNLMQDGVTASFKRLHWPGSDAPEAQVEPIKPGLLAPASVPPLHLEAQDARFGDAVLGNVWLETWPTPEGMHIERLDIHSDAMDIQAKGDWTGSGTDQKTQVSLDYSSHDAGALMAGLGFSRLIDGAATHGRLQLAWQGAPADFDWSRTDGTLELSLNQGRILEVEPGAGRLFGLLNLTEIPRRLALDFSDFFKSGFAFNQMGGRFEIRKGDAFTTDFSIDAPSARILLSGRTGLKARDYDQTMDVRPKAGSVLPAIGALAAGPAGAAVGAVAQAVLRQPLSEMARTVYKVTGSWLAPQIEVVERNSKPESPPSSDPPTAVQVQ